MKYPFLNEVNGSVIFTGKKMEIYLSEQSFKDEDSEVRDNYIYTFGIFDFLVYANEDDLPSKAKKYSLTIPMYIEFQYDSYFESDTLIKDKLEGDKYRVFVLKEGDIFVKKTEFEQNANNTKTLVFDLNAGKLPNNIRCDKPLKLLMDSMEINKSNLENYSSIFEIIIAELERSKSDLSKSFRQYLNTMYKDDEDIEKFLDKYGKNYQFVSIKKIPSLKSTFSDMSFEDTKNAIKNSILKTKNNTEEIDSPLEKVLTY